MNKRSRVLLFNSRYNCVPIVCVCVLHHDRSLKILLVLGCLTASPHLISIDINMR